MTREEREKVVREAKDLARKLEELTEEAYRCIAEIRAHRDGKVH